MKTIKKQQGVALFVTLLVVTIATLLATEIWFNNSLDISRHSNNRSAYQATHYAKGMFLWVKDILRQDFEENSSFDNHGEIWNQPLAGIQLEDAVLSGKLTDMDSKFNLNNLVINNTDNELNQAYFQRILVNLELDPTIADKISDWLDADQLPRQHGAEDIVYLSKSPSYRSAGQPFLHISELKLVEGIDEQIYQRLKIYVTVVPVRGENPTTININTIPTLLLKSLDERLTTKDALNLYNEGNAANRKIADFFQQPVIQHLFLRPEQKIEWRKIISTRSKWYQAQVNVTMQETNFQRYALIARKNAGSRVEQWSQSAFD